MVKTNNLAGPDLNPRRPFRNGPDRKTITTDSERLVGEMVTEPDPFRGEGEYLRGLLIFSKPFAQATLLRERAVSCFIFESPTVGLLRFRSD